MQKFLFLTSTNLATNPRLVKELRLVTKYGFSSTVIQFRMGNWSDALTLQLQQDFSQTEFITLSALRLPFAPWIWSTLLQEVYSQLPVSFLNPYMSSIAAGKRSWHLLRQVKKLRNRFDWVIAHNPTAFYPALVYAQYSGAQLGLDVEDYHPGETCNSKRNSIQLKNIQSTLPFANYISYASPLIKAEIESKIKGVANKGVTILNIFPESEFPPPGNKVELKLKLVWFSQVISFNRGLENIINLVDKLSDFLELHLIGSMNNKFESYILKNKAGIFYHGVKSQSQIHKSLSMYDIGLALEPGKDTNNQLALSNKILAYFQSGLYILATPTPAQRDFLTSLKIECSVVELTNSELTDTFLYLISQKEEIRLKRINRYSHAKGMSWENIEAILIKNWNHST